MSCLLHLTLWILGVPLALASLALGAIGVWPNAAIAIAAAIALYLFVNSIPHLTRKKLEPGLYYVKNKFHDQLLASCAALQPPYYKQTPWIIGGDAMTLFPFLFYQHKPIDYTRRWLKVPANFGPSPTFRRKEPPGSAPSSLKQRDTSQSQPVDEHVALDFCFPPKGATLNTSKPFYLVLHGLNGGSSEPYVLDFVHAARSRSSGVCVLVARGLMSTPQTTDALFHGARVSDVDTCVKALREALPPETPLCLVGFSMGGIIAANYTCQAGSESLLASAVSISGSFDTRTNIGFWHSRRAWQPLLVHSLKENFVLPYQDKVVARGVNISQVEGVPDVVGFDKDMVAVYHEYPSLMHYYEDMSCGCGGKLKRLTTPMLAVHAMDDPIMSATGALVKDSLAAETLTVLLTKTGGHVGFPVGWNPVKKKWSWMSGLALDYCETVVQLKK
ncbi:unnamed protein product [Chrysoparadoxa australica]